MEEISLPKLRLSQFEFCFCVCVCVICIVCLWSQTKQLRSNTNKLTDQIKKIKNGHHLKNVYYIPNLNLVTNVIKADSDSIIFNLHLIQHTPCAPIYIFKNYWINIVCYQLETLLRLRGTHWVRWIHSTLWTLRKCDLSLSRRQYTTPHCQHLWSPGKWVRKWLCLLRTPLPHNKQWNKPGVIGSDLNLSSYAIRFRPVRKKEFIQSPFDYNFS